MISTIFVALVAIEHIYILILEMFLWTTPRALKAFGNTKQFAESTKTLAANQGIYNGFLAAGLIWALLHPDSVMGHQLSLFFLICIIVAAVYGCLTSKKSILYIQGFPAIIALITVILK